jgi:hypothetical protein
MLPDIADDHLPGEAIPRGNGVALNDSVGT